MVFRPNKWIGTISGVVIGLTIAGVIAVLAGTMYRQALGAGAFITAMAILTGVGFLLMWAERFMQLLTLSYVVDRNALTIHTGLQEIDIPLSAIERIAVGADESESARPRGVNWPGFLRRRTREGGRGLYVLSTEPPRRQLVVYTASASYRISPRETNQFVDALQSRRALGSVREVVEGVRLQSIAAWPIWGDRLFWGLVFGALAMNVALWGVVAVRFGGLPERMALHFDASGQVDRVAGKAWVLGVPGIGSLATLLNGWLGAALHRRERVGGLVLQGVSLVVHVVLGLAAAGILRV